MEKNSYSTGATGRKQCQQRTLSLDLQRISCLLLSSGSVKFTRESCMPRNSSSLTASRIAALFNALAVHVYTICTSRAIDRSLAETRAKVCMLGLSAMQNAWPVGGWVLKLFEMIMHKLRSSTRTRTSNTDRRSKRPTSRNKRANHESGTDFSTAQHNAAIQQHDNTDEWNTMKFPSQQPASYSTTNEGNARNALSTPSYSFSDLGYDIPDMFFFDDAVAGAVSDQENFFQWLELPRVDDVSQHHLGSR